MQYCCCWLTVKIIIIRAQKQTPDQIYFDFFNVALLFTEPCIMLKLGPPIEQHWYLGGRAQCCSLPILRMLAWREIFLCLIILGFSCYKTWYKLVCRQTDLRHIIFYQIGVWFALKLQLFLNEVSLVFWVPVWRWILINRYDAAAQVTQTWCKIPVSELYWILIYIHHDWSKNKQV